MEGLSFGQSANLKDDLDVDDNDVGEKKRQAFLDLLMEAGQNGSVLTDTEVKEQVDTIMFEVSIRGFVITSFKRLSINGVICLTGTRHDCGCIQLLLISDGLPSRHSREGYPGT